MLIGATYAYFILSNGEDAQSGVHITSNTTDSLMFEIERDISLTLDTDNFLKDSGNQSDSVWAKAELLPNNKTGVAHDKYNMYFVITDNEFNYVTNSQKAEILLKVIDTKGTDVETDDEVIDDDVEGLSYVTITDGKSVSHSGYDITNAYGLYKIISEKSIDANGGSEVHKYNIEVVFINYNENQSKNAGKDFDAAIVLSKEDYEEYEPVFVNTINVEKSANSITTTLNVTEGSSEIDKYYFKAEAVEEKSPTAYIESKSEVVKLAQGNNNDGYVERSSASYTFDAVANKKYNIYAYTVDKIGIKSNIYKQTIINDGSALPLINNVESKASGKSIKVTINTTSSNIEKYCYSINKERYECTNTNIYTFKNINNSNSNNISVYITDNNQNRSLEYKIKIETKIETLTQHIISLYNPLNEGENGIYLHDGKGTYNEYNYGELEAGSNAIPSNPTYEMSYRYAGSNDDVKNYVCFGGTCDESGTSENLYRIIGVFDNQVKLIKANYAKSDLLGTSGAYNNNDSYYWSQSGNFTNRWSSSLLNQYNLNSGYTPGGEITVNYGFLYTIGETWANMIADHTWVVGGNTWANIGTVSGIRNIYNNEIINSAKAGTYSTPGYCEINYTNKIGLMYVTDYMYASDPRDASKPWSDLMCRNDNQTKDFRAVKDKNWMSVGIDEWTILRNSNYLKPVFHISESGYVYTEDIYMRLARPVFYLKTNVMYIGGDGTAQQPYIIELEENK